MPDRLLQLIKNDQVAMSSLKAVRDVGPPDAYLAAGFIRNRYWDSLYATVSECPDVDIDVVYYDCKKYSKSLDQGYEQALECHLATGIWQVRNQARMHSFGNYPPFSGLSHALCHWAETATTVGVRLTGAEQLQVIAPYGLDDLYGHILRITTPMEQNDPVGFKNRLEVKGWQKRWPKLTVIGP